MNFFVKFYQEEYQQQFRIEYRIMTNKIKEICLMKYIDFEWDLDLKDSKGIVTLKGSPVNSFVFFWEKEKTSYTNHPIALVLPKL